MTMKDLLDKKEEVFEVVGAAMPVYNTLRPGFLETYCKNISSRRIKISLKNIREIRAD